MFFLMRINNDTDNSTLHSKINKRKCPGNSPILSKQIVQFKTIKPHSRGTNMSNNLRIAW